MTAPPEVSNQKSEAATAKPTADRTPAATPPAALSSEEIIDRFRERILAVSAKRIEALAEQDSFEVKKRDGSMTTLVYRPVTTGEYRKLQHLGSEIKGLAQKYKDQLKNAKPDEYDGIVSTGKDAIAQKVFDLLGMSAEFFFGLKYTGEETDEFYSLPYKDMVEIIAACRARTDNGNF